MAQSVIGTDPQPPFLILEDGINHIGREPVLDTDPLKTRRPALRFNVQHLVETGPIGSYPKRAFSILVDGRDHIMAQAVRPASITVKANETVLFFIVAI